MRIYLDHCAYNRTFDDQSNIKNQLETTAKLYIQNQIREGKYDLVWSYMSDFENERNPNIENKNSIGGLTNKEVDGIKIVNPIDFVRMMEEDGEN
jgi:hypothetical protein